MTFSVPVSVSLSSVEVVSSVGLSSEIPSSGVSSIGVSSVGVSSIGVSSVGVSSVGVSSPGASFGFFLNPAVIFSQNFLNFLFIVRKSKICSPSKILLLNVYRVQRHINTKIFCFTNIFHNFGIPIG